MPTFIFQETQPAAAWGGWIWADGGECEMVVVGTDEGPTWTALLAFPAKGRTLNRIVLPLGKRPNTRRPQRGRRRATEARS